MMKSYALLALGLVCSLSATAESVRETCSAQSPITQAKAVLGKLDAAPAKISKAPVKVSSVEDFYGDYEWVYDNLFDGDAGGWQTTVLTFSASDEENTVIITGYKGLTWKATVDVEASTISIAKQFAFTSEDGKDIYLTPFKIEVNDEGYITGYPEQECVVGTLADGAITFDQFAALGLPNPAQEGSFYGPLFCCAMTMTLMPIEEINLDEWNIYDNPAEFTESWVSPLFNQAGTAVTYEVKVASYKENPNRILIIEPYNNEVWKEVNLAENKVGYIEIDITNPDVVKCLPRLYSGFGMDQLYEEDPEYVEGLWNYNLEGYLYYLNGVSDEEIEERLFSSDYEISYYQDGVVYIYNCTFGFTSDKNACLSWKELPNASVLKMPAEYEAGVEGVEIDNSNAPVKYYNIQGVEIANPEKGQLVIKRQGTSSEKVIVR